MDAMVAGSAAHVIAGNTERVRSARAPGIVEMAIETPLRARYVFVRMEPPDALRSVRQAHSDQERSRPR
jgi:hypothetical protein